MIAVKHPKALRNDKEIFLKALAGGLNPQRVVEKKENNKCASDARDKEIALALLKGWLAGGAWRSVSASNSNLIPPSLLADEEKLSCRRDDEVIPTTGEFFIK